MTDRDAKRLANRAKGDFSKSILTKTGGLLTTYLYDKPLIEHIDSDEQPEFVKEISNTHKISKGPSSDKNDLFARNGSGKSYLLVTDQRIICVMGAEDGDVTFEIRYDDLSKVTSSNSINMYFSQNVMIKSGTMKKHPKKVEQYIENKIQNDSEGGEKPPAGNFYVKSRSGKSGSPNEFCKNGDYQAKFRDKGLTLMNDSEQVDISYSSVASAKFHKSLRIHSKQFASSGYYDDPQLLNPRYDAVRLTVAESENPVHVYLITNMRASSNGKDGYHGHIYPSISQAVEYLRDKTTNNTVSNTEKFVLNEWIERNARLKIQEWDNRTVSSGSSLEGTIDTKGKSKGIQVGPFIRSKSKSESQIQIEDNSISIDQGGYTERIDCCIIYEDRIFVDTDPVIEIPYEDVERVMKRERGFAIQFGELTYSIEKIKRGKDELENTVEYITEKIQDSKSVDQDDSTNSLDPTEQIRELKELEEDGIITEEKFESKKQELLDQI